MTDSGHVAVPPVAGAEGVKSPDAKNPHQVAVKLQMAPTLIEHDGYRFVIIDSPNDNNIHAYIKVRAG